MDLFWWQRTWGIGPSNFFRDKFGNLTLFIVFFGANCLIMKQLYGFGGLVAISILFLLSLTPLKAQDVIFQTSGMNLVVNIVDESSEKVYYKSLEEGDESLYFIDKSEIKRIRYQDGRVKSISEEDYFETPESAAPYSAAETQEQERGQSISFGEGAAMANEIGSGYPLGVAHAQTYYRGHVAAGTGTLIVSLLSPLVGLLPALITASTSPKEHNFTYPQASLTKNVDYKSGYAHEARRIKSRRVWTNWGIGLGVNLILVLVLLDND